METELARTFLTVVAAGNFVSAAERLHVTQSTVSARIHTLEEQLGCSLFVRNKAGTRLTTAGRQFQKHATIMVRTVERARQDVGIAAGYQGTLTVGGRFGLWEGLLLEWLPLMRRTAPDISVRAEIGFEEDLMQGLVEGRIDIGVMYAPQSRPGLTVERLLEERLVLVSTKANGDAQPDEDYVYIDWGPEFYAQHGVHFPDYAGAGVVASIGWLGLQHILAQRWFRLLPASSRRATLGERPASPQAACARVPAAGLCGLPGRAWVRCRALGAWGDAANRDWRVRPSSRWPWQECRAPWKHAIIATTRLSPSKKATNG